MLKPASFLFYKGASSPDLIRQDAPKNSMKSRKNEFELKKIAFPLYIFFV